MTFQKRESGLLRGGKTKKNVESQGGAESSKEKNLIAWGKEE